MFNILNNTKLHLIITAIAVVPIYILGAYFSNVHTGPGNEYLFWFGVFLLMPVYSLSELGVIFTDSVFWTVVILLEPLWVLLLVKVIHAGLRLAINTKTHNKALNQTGANNAPPG